MISGEMRRAVLASLTIIIAQLLVGIYLYPRMPDRVAIHWGLSGDADGYGPKFLGLFLVPLISAGALPLFLVLPGIDPSRGIHRFRRGYDWFVFGFVAFLTYMHGITLAWNLGLRLDMMRMLAPALGAMFFGVGVLMGRAKRNWFVGIRTPWTLSDERVWDATHELGGRMFKACGVLALVGVLTEGLLALAMIMAPVIVASAYLIYFSYSRYQKLMEAPREQRV
jgi:uncharacterized membrane protein